MAGIFFSTPLQVPQLQYSKPRNDKDPEENIDTISEIVDIIILNVLLIL